MNNDIRNLTKWLNEGQEAPIDRQALARVLAMAEQPAPATELREQEPVAVPTTSYEHRKFVLVGRDWYERFAAFHDDCQIGEQLTWQEKTIRQQGYENGWNDAQRYLKEPQSTSPTPAQRTWAGLTDEEKTEIRRKTYALPLLLMEAIEAKLKEKNT